MRQGGVHRLRDPISIRRTIWLRFLTAEDVGSVDWIAHDFDEFKARFWIFKVLVAWITATYAALLKVAYIDPYRSWIVLGA